MIDRTSTMLAQPRNVAVSHEGPAPSADPGGLAAVPGDRLLWACPTGAAAQGSDGARGTRPRGEEDVIAVARDTVLPSRSHARLTPHVGLTL